VGKIATAFSGYTLPRYGHGAVWKPKELDMKNHRIVTGLLAGAMLIGGALGPTTQPAKADTASTAAIVAGAAAIVGALLIDNNNRPYYVNGGRRYYVTQSEASYWRQHHRVVQRRAYVPEQEYPVARNPYNH
jgi:hypothetical protein